MGDEALLDALRQIKPEAVARAEARATPAAKASTGEAGKEGGKAVRAPKTVVV